MFAYSMLSKCRLYLFKVKAGLCSKLVSSCHQPHLKASVPNGYTLQKAFRYREGRDTFECKLKVRKVDVEQCKRSA